MKVLFLDIETAPNTAYVWRLFKENVGIKQIVETSYVMCWAAKWMDEDHIIFDSVHQSDMHKMLAHIHSLLDAADVVVHFNGTSFDIPTLNKEFILHGFAPPAPYKQVDLKLVAKDKFRFTSNKMDFIAKFLGEGAKVDTTFELWVDCMKNDKEAWAKMREYNIHDVVVLEKLYYRFLPWISKHPNVALYSEARLCCPNCGSLEYQKRGFHYTTVSKFQRYSCNHCGNWFRDGINLVSTTKEVMRDVPA